MHSHDQHFLVVRAIKNPDAAAFRHARHRPPHVVVIKFFGGRRLEGKNLAALWIDTRHYVLDDAVFPGGIHRLNNQKQGVTVLRVELVLQIGEFLDPFLEQLLGFGLAVHSGRVPRIMIFEAKVFAVLDPKRPNQVLRFLHSYPPRAKP